MSFSQSTGSSQSTSTPVQTPENALINALSGQAASLSNDAANWANQEYTKTSAVTDQTVGNLFDSQGKLSGFANNIINQYNGITAPDYQSLHDEAASYASPTRQAVDMGAAGATQAQASDAALHSAEENLKSFGINPNDGRYASLDKAAAVQSAANVAGAENTQRNTDITTGQNLRQQSLAFGAQLPAAATNMENARTQANAAATNASLANANTGVNMKDLADRFLNTAMGIKLPPMGSQSTQGSQSTTSSPGSGAGSGQKEKGSGNGAGDGNGAGGPAWMPQHGGNAGMQTFGGKGGAGGPGSKTSTLPPEPPQQPPPWQPETGTGTIGQPTTDPLTGITDSTGLGGSGVTDSNPFQNSGFDQTYGGGGTGFDGNPTSSTMGGTNTWDPSQNQAQLPGGWQDPNAQVSTDPSIWGDNGGGAVSTSSGGNWGGSGADQTAGWTDPAQQTASDPSVFDSGSGQSYTDTSGGDTSSYAGGGAIPDGGLMQSKVAPRAMPPAPGMSGGVSPALSPSGGQQVDDVSAQGPQGPINLNSGEFVIPRDVAMWKGQEFFQNLISQSRQKRVMAPAHGKPASRGAPPQAQQPTG